MDLAAALPRAAAALEAGSPGDARRLCQAVLAAQPGHPDALNLCGVACFQCGDAGQAVRLLQAAVAQRPNFVDAYNNLGNVLRALARPDEAEAAYRRAIAAAPERCDAHYNLAVVLEMTGRLDEAVVANQRALELRPHFHPARLNLGNTLKALGRLDDAVAAYRQVLDGAPGHADALNNLGSALYELGERDAAESAYRRALEGDPRHADAHYNLGIVLQAQARLDEAICAYRTAIECRPHYGEAEMNLGYALHEADELDEAAAAYERALALEPDSAQVRINLGDVLLHRGQPQAAVALCDEFLEAHPGDTATLAFKSVALRELGDRDGARDLVDFDRFLSTTRVQAPAGFTSLAAFNAELARHVCAHPTLVAAPASHATRSGQHSGELLVEPKGPVAGLEAQVLDAVAAYRSALPPDPLHPFIAGMPEAFRLRVWGVVLEAGGHQVPHIHPSAWLSGVYYAEVPDAVGTAAEKPAGWIEFGRPPDHFHGTVVPELRLCRPQAGEMLLFPSYFYHRTIPFGAAGRRISIAFDVVAASQGNV